MRIRAKAFVDASGDANLARLAGAKVMGGMRKDGFRQPPFRFG